VMIELTFKQPKLDPPTDGDDDTRMEYSSGWEADEPGEDGEGTINDEQYPTIYTAVGYHKLDRKKKAENTSAIKKYGKKWSIPKMTNYQAPKKKDIDDSTDNAPDHKIKARARRTYGLASSERKEAKSDKKKNTGEKAGSKSSKDTKPKARKESKKKPTARTVDASSSEDVPIANTRPPKVPTVPRPIIAPNDGDTAGIFDHLVALRSGAKSQQGPPQGLGSQREVMINGQLVPIMGSPTMSPLSSPPKTTEENMDLDMISDDQV